MKRTEWSKVYKDVRKRLPNHLYLFPLVAGSTWLVVLSVLLIYWLARGRPTYPKQSNPYVPFISDIAAWHFKPFFIIGCIIEALSFAGTTVSVHYARHSQQFYGFPGSQSSWRRIVSNFTLVAGVATGASLLCLSIFDTARAHRTHAFLLLTTFGGIALSAVGTGLVWTDVWTVIGKRAGKRRERIGGARRTRRIRTWAMINFALMLIISILGIAFISCTFLDIMKPAGIIEWVVSYVGCFWLLSFVPFFTPKSDDQEYEQQAENENDDNNNEDEDENEDVEGDERRPLLTDQ